jgi:hypothetical protein
MLMPFIPKDLKLRGQPDDRIKGALRQNSWLELLECLSSKGKKHKIENGKLIGKGFDKFWRTLTCGTQ